MRGRTPSDGTRSQPSSTTPDAARSHSKLEVLVWIEPGWRRPPDNVPPLWRLDEILDAGGLFRRFLVLAHWPSPYVGSTHQLLHGQVRRQSRGRIEPVRFCTVLRDATASVLQCRALCSGWCTEPCPKVRPCDRTRLSVAREGRATRARA